MDSITINVDTNEDSSSRVTGLDLGSILEESEEEWQSVGSKRKDSVRFEMMERDLILAKGHYLFDNKPVILKPWDPKVRISKEGVKAIPTWIRLPRLDLKFWGKSCLMKLSGLVGKFLDEKGQEVKVMVEYEWRPIMYTSCKGYGHATEGNLWVSKRTPVFIGGVRRSIEFTLAPIVTITQKSAGRLPIHVMGGKKGLNSPNKQKDVKWFLHQQAVGLFGLLETKFIHVYVNELSSNKTFFITMVYTFIRVEERVPLWNKLKQFASNMNCAWLVCGDFNSVLRPNERLGSQVTVAETKDFNECVEVCGLMEMCSRGAYFTWNNKHERRTRVYSKLDRCFINDDWMLMFPDSNTNFLPEGNFDNNPCVIDTALDRQRGKAPCRYFNIWSTAPKFQHIVQNCWGTHIQGIKMFKVVRKFKLLKKEFKSLNHSLFSNVENSADVAYALITDLQKQLVMDPGNKVLMDAELEAAKSYQLLANTI
ncbi:uncharacterized protein LOC141631805 [Silene latifolia]|uniref:uncharacterized protein LOC141631805 n=1 Tax=Silene latifolia TaxID=37657 RepID=UPI003D776CEB